MVARPNQLAPDTTAALEDHPAYQHLKRAYERAEDPDQRYHLRHASQYLLAELDADAGSQ